MKQSYWCYIPIVSVVLLGFAIGGYLSYGVTYLNVFPCIEDHFGRKILSLFGVGILGAATYCARAWAIDIDEVVYREPKYLPHILDFIGYITLITGGGITGVILYFLAKTGISISTTANTSIDLTPEAAVLTAYIGGLFHFKVQAQLGSLIEKIFKNSSPHGG